MKNFRQLQEELKPQGTVRVQWDELDMTNIGADVASRIPEDDGPHTYGIGDAKNFVTTADPSSVVNQQNSEGNREFNMSVAPKKSGKPFKTLRGGRIKLHPEDLTGAVADVSIGEEVESFPFDKNFMNMKSEEFVAEIIYKQTRNGKLRKERPSVVDAHNKEIETNKKGMKEEVESLDELTNELKNRYIKKARKSQASLLDKADKATAMASIPNGMKQAKHQENAKYLNKKVIKRMVGVVRARASMMGEDVHDWKEEARHLRLREKIEHGMSLLKPVAAHKKAYEYYPKADKSGLPKASIQQYVGEGSAMGALTRKFGDRADAKIAGPRDSVGRLLPKGTSFDDYLKASSDHTIDGRKQKWTHRLPNSASANQHQEYKKFSERTRAEAKEAKAAAQAAERKAIDDRREARNKKKSNTTKGK